jgi:exonuclease III
MLSLELRPVTFEYLVCSLKTLETQAVLVAVYRPGSAHPSSSFFHEFTALLEELVPLSSQLIIAGDFNIHVDDPDSDAGVQFR